MLSYDERDNDNQCGYTDIIEAIGTHHEILEFILPIEILHDYERDATIRFELSVTFFSITFYFLA